MGIPENNGYWLELKIELPTDNPLISLKEHAKDYISSVVPYFQGVTSENNLLLDVYLKSSHQLNSVRKYVEENLTPKKTMTYCPGTERTESNEVVVSFWANSPSFNLLNACLLRGYQLLPDHNPSEHFLVHHNDINVLLSILAQAYNKIEDSSKNKQKKFDWFISDKMGFAHPRTFHKLLDSHKFYCALQSGYFEKKDKKHLSTLAHQLQTVTGQSTSLEELTEELSSLEKRYQESFPDL